MTLAKTLRTYPKSRLFPTDLLYRTLGASKHLVGA